MWRGAYVLSQSLEVSAWATHSGRRLKRLFESLLAVDRRRRLKEKNRRLLIQESARVVIRQRHARAHPQDRHRAAKTVGGLHRILTGRDLEIALFAWLVANGRSRLNVFEIDHAKNVTGVESIAQLFGGQFNRNREPRCLTRRRIKPIDHLDRRKYFLAFEARNIGDLESINLPDKHAGKQLA